MSRSARSVFVFALYLFALGAALLLVPNRLLSPFGFAETGEVWIRVVGMLALILGYYYRGAARHEAAAIFRLTVHARGSVLVFFSAFVLLGLAPPALVLFGAVDALGALWTWRCLAAEPSADS